MTWTRNNYIIKYFGNLMTNEEHAFADKIVKVNKYLNIASDPNVDRNLLHHYMSEFGITENDILEVQKIDKTDFYQSVANRIISENDLFINKCPFCGEIARTPTAYQASCGHQWRDHVLVEIDGKKKWVKK